MSYLIAFIGLALFVPFPAIGLLLFAAAVWMHDAGLAGTGAGEWTEVVLFFGAVVGIASLAIPQ